MVTGQRSMEFEGVTVENAGAFRSQEEPLGSSSLVGVAGAVSLQRPLHAEELCLLPGISQLLTDTLYQTSWQCYCHLKTMCLNLRL